MKTRSKPASRRGGGKSVTQQHDLVKTSARRRTSKKTLLKQKRFRLKIEKALAPRATHHTYTEMTNIAYVVRKLTAGLAVVEQYHTALASERLTLSAGSTVNAGMTTLANNLHNLIGQTTSVATGAQATGTADERDLKVLSSSLELSLSNISPIGLMFELYWCVATSTENSTAHATPQGTWRTIMANNTNLGAPGDKMTPDQNGVTPEQAVGFGKYWKILQKQRLYIQAGQTSDFTFNGGGYNYRGSVFAGQVNIKGLTKGLLIVAGIGDNTNIMQNADVFRWHTTRKYRVMYPEGKDQIPNLPTNTTFFTT